MVYVAPSLEKLLAEVNQRWPNRDKASDGGIGDAAHAARVSDHNPDYKGCVHARDFDKDGIDTALLLRNVLFDPRVHYVIWQGQEYDRENNFRPVPYYGINGHYHHMHISILHTTYAETNTNPWFNTVEPQSQEWTVADVQAVVNAINAQTKALTIGDQIGGPDTHPFNLETIISQNKEIIALLKALVAK